MRILSKLIRLFISIFLIIAVIAFMRTFIINIYIVSSISMYPYLDDGDYIVINRFSPLNGLEYDDVVVFYVPLIHKRTIIVKRCKGLPGDQIELRDDRLIINGKISTEPSSISYHYSSKSLGQKIMHPDSANLVRKLDSSLVLMPYLDKYNNNFGPIDIPSKGSNINLKKLSKQTRNYYFDLINKFENRKIRTMEGSIYIDGKIDSIFHFNNDYYFLLGDNRQISMDSRRWGLVPEKLIIGKEIFSIL